MSMHRNIFVTFGTKYFELILTFISSIILARILTPSDFGIYSIAASITLIGYLFRDFGVSQFIIRAKELDPDIIKSAFTVTLLISFSIGVILALVAPLAGNMYNDSGVTTTTYFLALNFFLLPFGSIADASLRRNLEFNKLAIINSVGAALSFIVCIGSALLGAKYLSIAWAANASTLSTVVLSAYYRPKGLPWGMGFHRIGEVLRFGIHIGGLNLTEKGADSATEMIIGKLRNVHDLGIYSRAFGTYMLFEYAFINAIGPVILPYFSQLNRDKRNIGKIYLMIIGNILMFAWPFYSILYVYSSDAILLLYGTQWVESIPILELLCIAGIISAPTIWLNQLLISMDMTKSALYYQIWIQSTRVAILFILVEKGLEYAAIAFIASSVVRLLILLFIVFKKIRVRIIDLLFSSKIPLLTTVSTLLISVELSKTLSDAAHFYRLSAAALSCISVWALILALSNHPLKNEILTISRKFVRR